MNFAFPGFHPYGFIISLAILAGYLLARKRLKNISLSSDDLDNILFWTVIPGIIGARIYHILDKLEYYRANWTNIWQIWQGGLGIFGAIIGGVGGLWIFTRFKRFEFLAALDFLIPSLALGQAIGRWGNFVNQEAFGPPTALPWGIYIRPENRPLIWQFSEKFQPLFLYESLSLFFAVVVLLWVEGRVTRKPGFLTGLYFLMYGGTRMTIEPVRFETARLGDIPTAMVISAIFIVTGFFLIINSKLKIIVKI